MYLHLFPCILIRVPSCCECVLSRVLLGHSYSTCAISFYPYKQVTLYNTAGLKSCFSTLKTYGIRPALNRTSLNGHNLSSVSPITFVFLKAYNELDKMVS